MPKTCQKGNLMDTFDCQIHPEELEVVTEREEGFEPEKDETDDLEYDVPHGTPEFIYFHYMRKYQPVKDLQWVEAGPTRKNCTTD